MVRVLGLKFREWGVGFRFGLGLRFRVRVCVTFLNLKLTNIPPKFTQISWIFTFIQYN